MAIIFDKDIFLAGMKRRIRQRLEENRKIYGIQVSDEDVNEIIEYSLIMDFPEPVIELQDDCYSFGCCENSNENAAYFRSFPTDESLWRRGSPLYEMHTVPIKFNTNSRYIFFFKNTGVSYNEIIDVMYDSCNLIVDERVGFLHRWVNRRLRIALESHDIEQFATLMEDKRLDFVIIDDILQYYLYTSVNNGWGEVTMILLRKIEERRRNSTELDMRL